MVGVEDYSKRGVAERAQFRAKPSANSEITLNVFGLSDKSKQVESTSVVVPATGQTVDVPEPLSASGVSIHAFGKDDDIGDGFRAVTNVDYVNTMKFRLTWSPSYSEAVNSEAVQSGFVSKNWDTYSFNVYAERYQDFLATQPPLVVEGDTVTVGPTPNVIIRHLPSVEFAGDDRQIGHTPFYFSFQTSADLVGRTQDPSQGLSIPLLSDRLDFHPQIMLRSREFWHFRFNPYAGFRTTYYGASLVGKHTSLDRVLGEVGFDLRPPSLEKIFNNSYHGYRLKHVMEPDIQYHLVRAHDPDNILDIVRFDALDIFTETNEVEYSLTNSILARKDVPDNSADVPQARDIFSWRLSQKYYFDPTFGNALVGTQNNVFASTIDVTGFAFEHGQRFSPVTPSSNSRHFQITTRKFARTSTPPGKAAFWTPASPPTSSAASGGFPDRFLHQQIVVFLILGGNHARDRRLLRLDPFERLPPIGLRVYLWGYQSQRAERCDSDGLQLSAEDIPACGESGQL